jgi:hypothetical protein
MLSALDDCRQAAPERTEQIRPATDAFYMCTAPNRQHYFALQHKFPHPFRSGPPAIAPREGSVWIPEKSPCFNALLTAA